MKVLVAHASKLGGTAGLAEMVSEALGGHGVESDVRAVGDVKDLRGYDAVIIGGGLYAGRWPRSGRRFVKHNADALRSVPVWCFSSGPLDDSAARSVIAAPRSVAAAMERIGARGHMTFGGRLEADAKGFPASAMAKKSAGDWRDPEHVARWVDTVVAALVPAGTATGA